ncbi:MULTISPECIES: SRPBCC family protein [Niastella]|uniref:SRPBCC domain-containing protein n=1 Tax=Niastella soli TaxID=2821487 RepID=A0ABS3YTD2_9BACT|nr:SRPBCC domain-containing protein [Niastella soli]MBO9201143.1 SRPBCC domain-containing protein [Niastella soli]
MKKNLILTKERQIEATPEKIWSVLTENQWIEQWLGVQMITDWKVGSPIAFTFVYKDKEVKDKGTLLHFEAGKKISYNYWSVFSATEDSPENYSEITFTLAPDEKGILLQLTQANFASQMLFAHAEKNWADTLETIKKLAEEEAGYRL